MKIRLFFIRFFFLFQFDVFEHARDAKFFHNRWWMTFHHEPVTVTLLIYGSFIIIQFCEIGSKIIVRPEEALIVILVLILWVGAIGLFFHRWGKIRMLEPYTPKFEAAHRPSCPLVSMDPIVANKRMSLAPLSSFQCGAMWNPNAIGIGRGERNHQLELHPRVHFNYFAILFYLYSLFTVFTASSEFCFRRTTSILTAPASKENKIGRGHSFASFRSWMRGLAFNYTRRST